MSKEPNRNIYVGHRYVPKIMGEWDNQTDYEGLSIVTNQGTSYTSKKRVPVGIDILNNEFWVVTGNYNAQVEYYRDETERVSEKLDSKSDITYVDTELGKKSDQTYVDTELDKKSDQTYVNSELDTKVDKGELVIHVKDHGVIGDGVTDDTNALQNVFNIAKENNYTVDMGNGEYLITNTVEIDCFLNGLRATIIADSINNAPAVRIGKTLTTAEGVTSLITVNTPKIINKHKEWFNSIGVEISNLAHCKIFIPLIKGFSVGGLYTAYGQGTSYNIFDIGFADDNKVNLKIDPKADGWVNENTFQLMRSAHRGGDGVNVPGTKHIYITHTGNHQPNNNVFLKPSIEGNVTEYAIDIEGGGYNMFISPRFEASNNKVRFGWEGSAKFAQGNVVFQGYGAGGLGFSESSGSRWNTIYGLNEIRKTGSLNMSNPIGGDAGVINILGSNQSPITAGELDYIVKVNQRGIALKNAVDTESSIRMTPAGALEFGNNDSKKTIRNYGENLEFSGGNFIIQGKDWDEPHLQLGNYHLWIDDTGKLRIKNSPPVSSNDGTIVGEQTT